MKTLLSPEQLNKLPKYARDEILNLRRELGEQKNLVATLSDTGVSTEEAAIAVSGSYGEPDMLYPAHTRTEFYLKGAGHKGRGNAIRALVMTDEFGEKYLSVNGNGGIVVEPRASNDIRVYLKE